jgi:hypothetical protein
MLWWNIILHEISWVYKGSIYLFVVGVFVMCSIAAVGSVLAVFFVLC